jgi:hypothetical protein
MLREIFQVTNCERAVMSADRMSNDAEKYERIWLSGRLTGLVASKNARANQQDCALRGGQDRSRI